MPFATTPAANGNRAGTFALYDSSLDRARFNANVQASLLPRVQLNVQLDYDEGDSDPGISGAFDVLSERSSALDLQVAAGWHEEGINNVAAVFGEVAAGRTVGASTYVFGSGRVDFGTSGEESGLRLGAAAVRPLGSGVTAGFDSRIDVDLAQDEDEPMGESGWALTAGPVIGYANKLVAVTASAGIAASDPRTDESSEVGGYAGAGLGVAF